MEDPCDVDRRLAELYDGLDTGFDTPTRDRDAVDRAAGQGAASYGEVTVEGVRQVLHWLRPTASDVLYDLGSGIGRFVVQAVCATDVGAAVGVELAPHRASVAATARARLSEAARRRLTLHHADLATFDWRAATLVWVGATCFPERLVRQIARAAYDVPALSRLLTTQPLPPPVVAPLREVGSFSVAASWADEVDVFVYAGRGSR